MLKEYDMVKAVKNLSPSVSEGCIGAIVMVYDTFQDKPAYEVEFVDDNHNTIDVLTVASDDIKAIN